MRNLIRRFVEAGVPGYHIEDQRPGTKKCGHQGGKVLVPSDEQIKRLNTARFQLDIMRVPGIIVARTDAEAANLIDSRADERDQPFLLGATNLKIPSYKSCFLAMMRRFYDLGVTELNGHLLYALPDGEYAAAEAWLERQGILDLIAEAAAAWQDGGEQSVDALFDKVESRFVDAWQDDAGLKTYGEAVAELLEFREREGEPPDMSAADWRAFARTCTALLRPRKGQGAGRRRRLGLRAGEDARGLLPGLDESRLDPVEETSTDAPAILPGGGRSAISSGCPGARATLRRRRTRRRAASRGDGR